MNLNFHPLAGLTRFERWFLGVAWVVIVTKCFVVAWAVPHYHVPVQSIWIIGPTLFFAALVTVLWLTHHEESRAKAGRIAPHPRTLVRRGYGAG